MQLTLPLFSFKSNLFLTLIRFIKKVYQYLNELKGRSKSALEVMWLVRDKEDSGGGQGGRGGKEPSRRQRVRMTIVSSKSSSKAVKDLVELCYASVDTAGEGMLGLHARRLSLRG